MAYTISATMYRLVNRYLIPVSIINYQVNIDSSVMCEDLRIMISIRWI